MLKQLFTAATVIEQSLTIALLRKLVAVHEHRVRTLTGSNGLLRATNEAQKQRMRELAGELDRSKAAHASLLAAASKAGVKLELVGSFSNEGGAKVDAESFRDAMMRALGDDYDRAPVTEPEPRRAGWEPPAPPSRESKL